MSTDTWRHANRLTCPACGYRFDSQGGPGGSPNRAPGEGTYTICFRCGEVMIFAVGPLGTLVRECTSDELAKFARDPAATELVRNLHRFWAERGGAQ